MVNHDYKRNIKVCKKLKDKHGLTYGEGKERVKREKLRNPDKVKYLIYDTIKAVLPHCKTEKGFQSLLLKSEINVEFKLRRTTGEIEGISFLYGNISFKGSRVDRKFSYGNLKKEFDKNRIIEEEQKEKARQQARARPKQPSIGGVKLTPEQWQTLKDGGFIYLENMKAGNRRQDSGYVFTDDRQEKAFVSAKQPDSFIKYGKYEMRLMDKMRIEAGFVTKAKVKWYGIGTYAYPYLWKDNKSDAEYQEAWDDPRQPPTKKTEQNLKQPIIRKKNRGEKI